MDVRLPDGTVIRGVPDGMSKADLTAKLQANGYDVSKLAQEAPPAEGMPQQRQAAPMVAQERRNYSAIETPIEAIKNIPQSAVKFGAGIAEAITSPIKTLGGLWDAAAGGLRAAVPEKVRNFIDEIDNNPDATKRISDTANAIGGMYKDRYGDFESIKRSVAEDPVGVAADLSAVLTGGGAAAAKAGSLSPTLARAGSAISKAGSAINPANAITPLIQKPIEVGVKGTKFAYNALDPKSAAYIQAAEGRGPEILNALVQPSEIVPGSMPTAAQAASNVGATKFSAMGESSAKTLPTQFLEREQAQKAAQLRAVQSVGKTPEDIKIAEASRRNATKPLYKEADKKMVAADQTFNDLLDRPSMDKVISRAQNLAKENNETFQVGKNVPEQVVPSSILNSEGRPISSTTIPAEVAKYSGASLHKMKMAFDDLIKNPERFGIGASEVNAIEKTRAEYINWMENKVPAYGVARQTYAEKTVPINQMQVGQFLEGKLTPALGEESARLRSAGYASALDQAPGTIKKATGQSRFEQLSEVLTPEQMQVLQSVKDDLSRAQLTELQAVKARGAAQNTNMLSTQAAGQLPPTGLVGTIASVANNIFKRLQGKLDQKLAIELATEMLDPNVAAVALQKAMARQSKFQGASKVTEAIPKNMRGVSNAMVLSPANQNALNQPGQQ